MPQINIQKRREIMARSMKLGHCICDPKRPCPCDVFTGMGLCPCAGERPDPVDMSTLKLTDLVHNAGCASKIAAQDLERFLARLPVVDDPAILSGLPAGDDAAVYRLSDDVTLVQTVDVFTPCVDDPYVFGKICAANCLSDVYAMGGKPKTALSVLAFPSETLDGEIMYLMMKGATEILNQAGCALVGGHSIKDEEIKLGFAITGLIDADSAVSHESAKVGDALVLTKPLGVGVLNFARQIGKANETGLKQAEHSMMTLNREAAEVMGEVEVSACTDVTGFSLLGHLARMVRHSKVTARIWADSLPSFEGALDLFAEGVIPGAVERNKEFVAGDLSVGEGVSDAVKHLGFDAQTSGGLLIAVPKDRIDDLLKGLRDKGVTPYSIGTIVESSDGKIELVASSGESAVKKAPVPLKAEHAVEAPVNGEPLLEEEELHDPACCADVFGAAAAPSAAQTPAETKPGETNAPASMAAFGSLMQSVGAAGVLDARTKELINFGLVLLAHCDPCLQIHMEKALAMGITQEELDEVAWCAIAMGGAPVKMFYTEFRDSMNK